jgi:hypothetical protein
MAFGVLEDGKQKAEIGLDSDLGEGAAQQRGAARGPFAADLGKVQAACPRVLHQEEPAIDLEYGADDGAGTLAQRIDRRLLEAERDVAAAGIAQRVGIAVGEPLDVADQHHMVAGIDDGVTGAVEPADRALDDGMTRRSGTPGDGGEFVRPLGGKDARRLLLGLGENADRKTVGTKKGVEARRALADADQQQRRIERHRGEGIGRETARGSVGAAGGNHRHAGHESAKCPSQLERIDRRHDVSG